MILSTKLIIFGLQRYPNKNFLTNYRFIIIIYYPSSFIIFDVGQMRWEIESISIVTILIHKDLQRYMEFETYMTILCLVVNEFKYCSKLNFFQSDTFIILDKND